MAEPIPLPTPAQITTMRALLLPLMRVSGLIVVLGIIFAVDAFTRALFGTVAGGVGWIPFVGRIVSQPIHRIEQKVSNYLGGLESHIDVSMGGYIHALATGVGQLASGEAEAGWATWLIAKVVHATRVSVDALPSRGAVVKITRNVYKPVKVVYRDVHRIGKIAAHAAPGSLVRVVRAIAGTLDDVVTWDIPRLRSRTRAIEHSLARLNKWIRTHPLVLPEALAVAAVAHALSKLGGNWIRCKNWRRIGKAGCRLPLRFIEEILAASLIGFAVADICNFAALAESIAEEFVPELMALVDVENALLGCHGATASPRLPIGRLYLPPSNLGLSLTG